MRVCIILWHKGEGVAHLVRLHDGWALPWLPIIIQEFDLDQLCELQVCHMVLQRPGRKHGGRSFQ